MASIGKGSQTKGKDYERRLAKILSESFGVQVKRTGGTERSKIVNKGDVNASKHIDTILNDFFWEAKCQESWSDLNWYKKAVDDAQGTPLIPVVVASKNYESDYVFMSLKDFKKILIELEGWRQDYEKEF